MRNLVRPYSSRRSIHAYWLTVLLFTNLPTLFCGAARSEEASQTLVTNKPIALRPLDGPEDLAPGIKVYIEERNDIAKEFLVMITSSEERSLVAPRVSLALGDKVIFDKTINSTVFSFSALAFKVELKDAVASTRRAWMRHREKEGEPPIVSSETYVPIRVSKLTYIAK